MANRNARCSQTLLEYHLGQPNNTLVNKSNDNTLLKHYRSNSGRLACSKVFDMIKPFLQALGDGPICSGVVRRQER